MLLLLLACEPTSDADRYLRAVANPDDPALCLPIEDPWLAGECQAMAASHRAGVGDVDGGLEICEAMPTSDPWRDECFFLLSDRITASGAQAVDICGRSGRYEDRCLGHAFGRDGRALLAEVAPGEELAAYRALEEAAAAYFPVQRTANKKLRHMMVEFIASRDPGHPFSAATCGDLPANLCRSGYLTRLRFTVRDAHGSEQTLHSLCRQLPLTVEEATAVGVAPWTADADPIVQSAWSQLCGAGGRR